MDGSPGKRPIPIPASTSKIGYGIRTFSVTSARAVTTASKMITIAMFCMLNVKRKKLGKNIQLKAKANGKATPQAVITKATKNIQYPLFVLRTSYFVHRTLPCSSSFSLKTELAQEFSQLLLQ
jgi:hypothetical protein